MKKFKRIAVQQFSNVVGARSTGISLESITADEVKDKELLGTAYGVGLSHCMYLGSRYCEDFSKARWYHIFGGSDEHLATMRKTQPNTLRIDFYAPVQERDKIK